MDVFRESRYIMHSFIIILVCWLGWLCGLAFAQVAEAFTGAANFPNIELTCLGNLAAFFTFILWGKGMYEDSEKRYAAASPEVDKLKYINGLEVLTTCRGEPLECSVVMLSFHRTLRMRRFMRRMSNLYNMQSICLPCLNLQSGAFNEEIRKCRCTNNDKGRCGCIVFNTVEDITMMLARRIPGTLKRLPDSMCLRSSLKRLPDSLCLLPCLRCLRNGCHGCNQGLLYVENDRLIGRDYQVEYSAAVSEILDLQSIDEVSTCICIPARATSEDEWTNQMIRFFEPQDKEFRGVVIRKGRTNAAAALENYKHRNGECDADEQYSLASLVILPWLAQALVFLVLIFWLKVDGFSSAVLSERLLRDHNSWKDMENTPYWFLIRARCKSNANNTNVCQVLFFRIRPLMRVLILWVLLTCVGSISWMVLVALEGGAHQWYHVGSIPPSEGRIIVIMVAICIAVVLDCFDLRLYLQIRRMPRFRGRNDCKNTLLICAVIVLEIVCIVVCSTIARVMGIKAFGRWIYSALQCLVWVKYIVCVLLWRQILEDSLRQGSLDYGEATWWYGTCGHYIAASAFLLNATVAGVRAKWEV